MAIQTQVFISHAKQDRDIAQRISEAFEAQGVRTWLAPRDISPGSDWTASIIDALDACPLMVLIFSGASNSSPHVLREVCAAVDRGKIIIPFRIDPSEISKPLWYFLSPIQWVAALTPPLDGRIRELMDAVLSALGSGCSATSAFPEARAKPLVLPPVRWTPKAIRLGKQYGLLTVDLGDIRLSAKYIQSLCAEAENFATTDFDRFLTGGWTPLHIDAVGKAKKVAASESDFSYFVSEAAGVPFISYLVDAGFEAKILSGTGDNFVPSPDLISELIEMTMAAIQLETLSGEQEVPRFTIGSLVELVAARLLATAPESLNHVHLIALFVYSAFHADQVVARLVCDSADQDNP